MLHKSVHEKVRKPQSAWSESASSHQAAETSSRSTVMTRKKGELIATTHHHHKYCASPTPWWHGNRNKEGWRCPHKSITTCTDRISVSSASYYCYSCSPRPHEPCMQAAWTMHAHRNPSRLALTGFGSYVISLKLARIYLGPNNHSYSRNAVYQSHALFFSSNNECMLYMIMLPVSGDQYIWLNPRTKDT
jgi:hypothetical protein